MKTNERKKDPISMTMKTLEVQVTSKIVHHLWSDKYFFTINQISEFEPNKIHRRLAKCILSFK